MAWCRLLNIEIVLQAMPLLCRYGSMTDMKLAATADVDTHRTVKVTSFEPDAQYRTVTIYMNTDPRNPGAATWTKPSRSEYTVILDARTSDSEILAGLSRAAGTVVTLESEGVESHWVAGKKRTTKRLSGGRMTVYYHRLADQDTSSVRGD